MKYTFSLTKNIHMYNHLLECTDGHNHYQAICESAVTKEPTLIFWIDDFQIPLEDKEIFIKELKVWVSSQGYHYLIKNGKGR